MLQVNPAGTSAVNKAGRNAAVTSLMVCCGFIVCFTPFNVLLTVAMSTRTWFYDFCAVLIKHKGNIYRSSRKARLCVLILCKIKLVCQNVWHEIVFTYKSHTCCTHEHPNLVLQPMRSSDVRMIIFILIVLYCTC